MVAYSDNKAWAMNYPITADLGQINIQNWLPFTQAKSDKEHITSQIRSDEVVKHCPVKSVSIVCDGVVSFLPYKTHTKQPGFSFCSRIGLGAFAKIVILLKVMKKTGFKNGTPVATIFVI
jgi:hypothetical protein